MKLKRYFVFAFTKPVVVWCGECGEVWRLQWRRSGIKEVAPLCQTAVPAMSSSAALLCLALALACLAHTAHPQAVTSATVCCAAWFQNTK